MPDLGNLILHAPTVLRTALSAQKAYEAAKAGDHRTAVEIALRDFPEASGLLHREAPNAIRGVISGLGSVYQQYQNAMNGNLIEGEYRELAPWSDFGRHLYNRDWAVIVIFGGKGFGKTELALKLAWQYQRRLGYPVELCNFWSEDIPHWATKISMRRLVARMRKVGRYLDQEEVDDVDDGLRPEELSRKSKKAPEQQEPIRPREIDQMKRRIVVVDEAALLFGGLSSAGQQESRGSAETLNNQVRHLNSIFILATQRLSDMPNALQETSVLFYRMAGEEVIKRDFKQGVWRANRERWQEVLTGLHAVKNGSYVEPLPNFMSERTKQAINEAAQAHRTYWGAPYDTIKAWSWVRAPSDIGGHGYEGVAPNTTWKHDAELMGEPVGALGYRVEEPDDEGEG